MKLASSILVLGATALIGACSGSAGDGSAPEGATPAAQKPVSAARVSSGHHHLLVDAPLPDLSGPMPSEPGVAESGQSRRIP